MHDTPWWLTVEPPETPPLPWSGEVVPIPAPIPIPGLPTIPQTIPSPGPIIQFVGEAEHATWDAVWGWIRGEAKFGTNLINQIETTVASAVLQTVETYVGKSLSAVSGFINDAFDYTQFISGSIENAVLDTWNYAYNAITYLDGAAYAILADVVAIDTIVIPRLEREIAQLGIDTWGLVGGAVAGVESWAIDNIYSPLDREIRGVDAKIRADVWGLTGAITGYLEHLIDSEAARRAAEIAALSAAVSALVVESETCTQPLCDVIGPKTDLYKMMKGLKVAAELAALAAILDMNADDLGALIHAVTSRLATVVDDVEQFLGPGGETVAGLIAHAAADLV